MLERVHDGDATAARRLAAKLDAGRASGGGELFHMAAEQGLVGRHHVFAGSEGLFENLGRGMLSADDLDHDIDGRVGHDVVPVRGELLGIDAELVGTLLAAVAHTCDTQVDAEVLTITLGVSRDETIDAPAHGAQSDDADVDGAGARLHGRLLFSPGVPPCGAGCACVPSILLALRRERSSARRVASSTKAGTWGVGHASGECSRAEGMNCFAEISSGPYGAFLW